MSAELPVIPNRPAPVPYLAALTRNPRAKARAAVLCALLLFAVLTPSFLSMPSLTSLLATASVIGCVAAGMTFITIGGNIMSFALGGTAAISGVAFAATLNAAGLIPALICALLLGGLVTGFQGFIVGSIRANPIIVSIAANILIYGAASWITNNETINYLPNAGAAALQGTLFGVPIEFLAFIMLIVIGQIILTFTVFGRNLLLIGSGLHTAEATGLPIVRTLTGAYLWAGLFTAVCGILLSLRYSQANMEYALHYDYDAIAAVLVGGTPIGGGDGSMIRTLIGVGAIAMIQDVLLLHGFEEEWRYLVTGLIVLLVIILYSGRRG